jgi:hypothetical protein
VSSGQRAVSFAVVLSLLLVAVPFAVVDASEVATTITMNTLPATAHFGDAIAWQITVDPAPPSGEAFFEWSSDDGTSWHVDSAGFFGVAGSEPGKISRDTMFQPAFGEGDVLFRSRYGGTEGFAASVTETQSVTLSRRPTTVDSLTINAGAGQVIPGGTINLVADPSAGDGDVAFDRWTGSAWTELGQASISSGDGLARIGPVPSFGEGAFTLRARFLGNIWDAPSQRVQAVTISKGTPLVDLTGPGDAEAGLPITLHVDVTSDTFPGPTGSVTIRDQATNHVVGSGAIGSNIQIAGRAVGHATFVAQYGGDSNYKSATDQLTVNVISTGVLATDVGLSATSIYPYKDGYRDSVSIKGSRQEPISVAIRIYSPTNHLVRSTSLATGSGAYAWAWNGRTSSGAALASGKYKVVQTLKDGSGGTRAVTSYVTLSSKRLSYRTISVTKNATSMTAKGTVGSASITGSSSGMIRMSVGTSGSSWAGVGYQFTLPSATVYRYLTLQVYSKMPLWAAPNHFGLQNFHTCAYSSTWHEECFDHWGSVGNDTNTLTWKSAGGSPSVNRYGRTVRGMVGIYAGTAYIYKVRIKLTYGVLV